MNDPFARLGAFMAKYRWLVLALWLAVIVGCGGFLAPKAGGVLKAGGIGAPGSESDNADRIAEREFGASIVNNVSVLFQSDTLTVTDPEYAAAVNAAHERLAEVEGVRSILSVYNLGDPSLVSADGRTTFNIIALEGDEGQTQEIVPHLREAMAETTELDWYVTGLPAINEDFQVTSENDLRRSELVTVPLVLVLLLIAFRTVISAAVPLVIGAASVLVALSAIYVIALNMDVSVFALNVASMIGLGIGIDFSLIVVSRYREELALGRDRVTATAITMATAGRSITYSGITVLLAMLILTVLFDLIIIRSIAMGVTIVAGTSLLAGLTLLPALLAVLHRRLEWLRVIPKGRQDRPAEAGFWYRLSHAIMRRPWPWLLASMALLIALAYPALNLKMIGADPGNLPQDIESVRGARIMEDEFGEARLTPVQVVMEGDGENSAWTPEFITAFAQLSEAIEGDERVQTVQSFPQFMRTPAAASPELLPPGTLDEVVLYQYGVMPQGPAFVGLALMELEPGFELPTTTKDALHIIHVESGALTFQTNGPATISEAPLEPVGQDSPPSREAPIATPFSVEAGDNLIVERNTPTSIRNDGSVPAELIVGVVFPLNPNQQPGTPGWDNATTSDFFDGVPRNVITSGIVTSFPEGPVDILIDRLTFVPGFGTPVHQHFGPELGGVVAGSVQAFGGDTANSTVVIDGEVAETSYTWNPLSADDTWIHQTWEPHGARNVGGEPTQFIEIRFMETGKTRAPAVLNVEPEAYAALEMIQPALFAGNEQSELVIAQFVNFDGANDTAIMTVTMESRQYDDDHQQFIQDLRDDIIPGIPGLDGFEVQVGGNSASYQDFEDALYGRFPYLVAAVLLLTFFILMMFFQSLLLPLKAVFMNIMSIVATYGALTLIFQHGIGSSLLGFESLDSLSAITPAILFVILFSLSTDYEVFMLSRVKEYYHETGNNEEAVAAGLEHTAGVITAAGLILIGTFGSFAVADILTVKEIGIGLAIGVLIDSTIVRVIMVPATMRLMGNLNWWMPAWLKRIVPEIREAPAGEIAPLPQPRPVPQPAGAPALAMSGSGMAAATATAGGFGLPSVAPGRVAAAPVIVRPPVGRLHSIGGSVGADVITLPRTQPFRIGRDPSSELQVFDVRISRNHARIDYQAGEFIVTDFGSTNGTIINGRRISSPTTLRDGDQLEIGHMGAIRFRFERVPPG